MEKLRTTKCRPIIIVISILLLGLFLSGCSPKMSSSTSEKQDKLVEKEVVLTLVSAWTPPASGTEFLPKFIDQVNNKGKGLVKIDFKGGAEVAPPLEQVDMVKKGAFDITFNTPNYYGGMVPGAIAIHTTDATTEELRKSGFWKVYDQMHRDRTGITTVGTLWRGEQFALSSIKPIRNTDWKGLRIKGFPLYDDLIKKFGGSSMFIQLPDLYAALSKGIVDATINPITLSDDYSLNQAAKYILTPMFPAVTSAHLIMNAERWDGLPEQVKAIILDVLENIEPEVDPFYKEITNKEVANLLANGSELIELSPSEAEKLIQAANSTPWEFINNKEPKWGPKLREAFDAIKN